VRAEGERRRRGASPGHTALSGPGKDGGRNGNCSADRGISFPLGAAGLGTVRAPGHHPAGSSARPRARPGAIGAGSGPGCSRPLPRAGLRLKQTGRAARLPQPRPPVPRAGCCALAGHRPAPTISHTPYSKNPPYGVAEVQLHSKENPSTQGGCGQASPISPHSNSQRARFWEYGGEQARRYQWEQHQPKRCSGGAAPSQPGRFGVSRRAGAGRARPDPRRGERCGSARCYHSMREISGTP